MKKWEDDSHSVSLLDLYFRVYPKADGADLHLFMCSRDLGEIQLIHPRTGIPDDALYQEKVRAAKEYLYKILEEQSGK